MSKKEIYQHSGVDHPPYLGTDGQKVFHKIVTYLTERNTWDDAYLELVAAASNHYEIYVRAAMEVRENGATVLTQGGSPKKNPAFDIAGSAFRDFLSFSNKFGLNPLFSHRVNAEILDDSEI